MTITRLESLAVAGVALLWACGSSGQSASQRARPTGGSSSLVTADELARVAATGNLYDALRSVRPAWFRVQPSVIRPQAETGLVVYLDRARLGDLDALRQIQLPSVVAVRYYSPAEAQGEFGPQHLHGAIQVFTSTAR